MLKVPGVETARVSLNDGLTILDLRAGNNVTIRSLRKIIKDSGFVSKEALVVAVGTVAVRGSDLVLSVAGTQEQCVVVADTERTAYDNLRRQAERGAVPNVEITGTVTDATQTPRLRVTAFRLASPAAAR